MTSAAPGNALPVNYKLGEYAIQSILGQGGFGITYLAQDTRLNTHVAIKEYFPRAYATRGDGATIHPHTTAVGANVDNYEWGLNEFLKEAQALAKFKHPHIVRVLRFLETNGTAYMVMEYEEGESLLGYLGRHGGFLPEQMLLGIFIPILTGLQAVHDAGLLHLDIKPDNIYLRKNGQPMLIDFGSSRQARESTAVQKVALSRGYAAPEQYPGPHNGERGPWSDVYGVGASLYRCMTGRDPVDSMERRRFFETRRIDPLTPVASYERPHYAPGLRAAADAALKLETGARPRSARALQNGLMGKEMIDVQAKPWVAYGRGAGFIGVARGALTQRHRRWARRSLFERTVAVLVFVATMLVVIPKLMIDTGHMTDEELYAFVDDSRATLRSLPRRSKQYIEEKWLGTPPAAVAAPAPVSAPSPVARPPIKTVPAFEAGKLAVREFQLAAPATSVALLLDGALVATATSDGAVQLWDGATGEALRTLAPSSGAPAHVLASPDGKWLIWSGADHTLTLWNLAEPEAHAPLRAHGETVTAFAFSADGKWFASAGEDMKVVMWERDTGKPVHVLASRSVVLALAFAPNERMLAGADASGGIQYWGLPGGSELAYTPVQDHPLTALAYAPDGAWVAAGGQQGYAQLLRAGVERDDRTVTNAPEIVSALAYVPDGTALLVAGLTESVEVRDVETGAILHRLPGHARAVTALALSNDGRWLAAVDDDNKVWLWR